MPALGRRAFRAMGTTVVVLGPPGHDRFDAAVDCVQRRFAREDQRFSRFRGDSELASVNGRSGAWVRVSPGFEHVTRLALAAADASDGRFDPTVLDAMVAAGYDRDFDEVLAGARGVLRQPHPCGAWRAVDVRPGAVRLPRNVGLDVGGIAKGWTADRAAGDALASGLPWTLVSAGGDLRIEGEAPPTDVAVEDPADGHELLRLRLRGGALATSSVTKRAWGPGMHHVIDPRTGRPARTNLLQATTWAATCASAEIAATDALLVGNAAAVRMPCVLVTDAGDVLVSQALARGGREEIAA